MKLFLFLTVSLFSAVSAFSKEYPTKKELAAATQTQEVNRRNWIHSDRERENDNWKNACAFNFSYATGCLEYINLEQREDFYEWLQAELRAKGHEVKWVAMALEVMDMIEPVIDRKDLVGLNAALANKLVFDSTFTRLQELYHMDKPLQGAAAKAWDDQMIKFEQEDLLQTIYNRMDIVTLEKITKMAKGEGLYFFKTKKKLRFKGDLRKSEDRIKYAKEQLLPVVNKKMNADFQEKLNQNGIKASDARSKRAAKKYLKRLEETKYDTTIN